jgi:hypothetical protein
MKPVHIELFIDRLCGLFPTTNIARNTLKSSWTKDDVLLDASEEDGKSVLKMCEGLDRFPGSLGEVKRMFRSLRGVVGSGFGCNRCDNSGWDIGRRITDGEETFYTTTYMGRTYTYVKPCECRTAA